MKIISYKLGHDGAIAMLDGGALAFSLEAEKDSRYRYSPLGDDDLFDVVAELTELPDVVCVGGWWPSDTQVSKWLPRAGYRGIKKDSILAGTRKIFGKSIRFFSSSHERSHLLCAFGLSNLPKGTPCYALVWEGVIGAFYEIDSDLNITLLGDVLSDPGNRYTLTFGLADPTFSKDSPFSRFSDSGKLMALASFATRNEASAEEEKLIDFLLSVPHVRLSSYKKLEMAPHFNVGLDDQEFRNFAGIVSDRVFEIFYRFARANMRKGLPLLIGGGCGLNCDWNSKWRESRLFPEVFVSPVANDSGAAIGTAIDAQLYYGDNPKVNWSVYSGLAFDTSGSIDLTQYDVFDAGNDAVAKMLNQELILAWVSGRYEIGPRALGNRSILAAPFKESTRIRLNEIKQREQYRPIAPVCLEVDAEQWFGCNDPSPYMLFTYRVRTDALAAVTHVNNTARIQTVSPSSNRSMYDLLVAFKTLTGYGVLCNTSLNFKNRGCINNITDLSSYALKHGLDGFVVEGRCYMVKSSTMYRAYLSER